MLNICFRSIRYNSPVVTRAQWITISKAGRFNSSAVCTSVFLCAITVTILHDEAVPFIMTTAFCSRLSGTLMGNVTCLEHARNVVRMVLVMNRETCYSYVSVIGDLFHPPSIILDRIMLHIY